MWWELHSFQHLLLVELSQLKQLALLVRGIHCLFFASERVSLAVGSSDFEELTPITVINNNYNPSTNVRLFTVNDETTLEYEDRVLLRFTPTQANLIPELASNYEHIRDTVVVNIIDDDRKCILCFC